uniref:Uncharacterized protein n=1 Tax=Caenorhabditis japonica TaxID=281687 RepID=A0A8R1IK18_CAEJA
SPFVHHRRPRTLTPPVVSRLHSDRCTLVMSAAGPL